MADEITFLNHHVTRLRRASTQTITYGPNVTSLVLRGHHIKIHPVFSDSVASSALLSAMVYISPRALSIWITNAGLTKYNLFLYIGPFISCCESHWFAQISAVGANSSEPDHVHEKSCIIWTNRKSGQKAYFAYKIDAQFPMTCGMDVPSGLSTTALFCMGFTKRSRFLNRAL